MTGPGAGPTGSAAPSDRRRPGRRDGQAGAGHRNGDGQAGPSRETVPAPARALLRSTEAKPDGRRITLYSRLPGPDRR